MSARRAFVVFSVASLIAVALGCVVAALSGVGTGIWGRNLAAWLVGALLALAIGRAPERLTLIAALILAVVGLAATFAFPGLDGVHRWIVLGPVRLNMAELLLPMAVVAFARTGPVSTTLLAIVAIALLLAFQPDRSQAVALAGAVVAVVSTSKLPLRRRILAAAVTLLAAITAMARPDPLQPVPEVEGIVRLAWAVSPVLAMLSVAALTAAVGAPLTVGKTERPAALALSVYLALTMAAGLVAPFPVPLLGMAVSSILGAWLGVGLLLRPTSP